MDTADHATRPARAESVDLELSSSIASAFSIVYAKLRRELANSEILSSSLTIERTRLLALLREYGPVRINELARLMHITQPAMTEMLRGVNRLGWVSTEKDATDRRAVLVDITSKGVAVSDEFRQARAELMAEALAGLDPIDVSYLREAVPVILRLAETLQPSPQATAGQDSP